MRTLITALLLAIAPAALAETAEEIMDKARETRQVDSAVQQVRMVLVSRKGSERVREMAVKMKRGEGAVMSYFRFSSPSDVAGTAFLQIDREDGEDDQLMYFPAYKKVQRIASNKQGGAFMGSDFTYEDLELGDPDGATHTVVDDTADGWVIDTDPGDGSSYGRIRSHVDKSTYLAKKVEFFDDEDALIKTLEVTEVTQNGDKHVAKVSVMKAEKGTATRLEVLEQKFDVPAEELPDEVFTEAYLSRGS